MRSNLHCPLPRSIPPGILRDILTTCLNGRDDDINVQEIKWPIAVKVGSFPDFVRPYIRFRPTCSNTPGIAATSLNAKLDEHGLRHR